MRREAISATVTQRAGERQLRTARAQPDLSRLPATVPGSAAAQPVGTLPMAADAEPIRLRAELEIARAHKRVALDATEDAMVVVDADETIQVTNTATERLFGYRKEELLGHHARMLLHDGCSNGDPQSHGSLLSGRQATPRNGGGALTGRRKDGATFPVEIGVAPFDSDPSLAAVTIRMASERRGREQRRREPTTQQLKGLRAQLAQKSAELRTLTQVQQDLQDALRDIQRQSAESLTLLDALQATTPIGLGFVDRELRICRMNETLAAINGLPLEQQVGQTVAAAFPDLWPRLAPIYAHVLATGNAVVNQDIERSTLPVVGDERHWLMSYYPVRLDDEIIGVGLVVVDIADREQADDFRAVVLENMAEGLAVADAEGRFMFMNAAATKLLGWTERELLGRSAHATIHHQHADGSPLAQADCEMTKVRTAGRSVRVTDDAFTRKDGSIFPVSYSAAPLHQGDAVRGVVVVFQDMTNEQEERTRAKRELNGLSWLGRIRDALDEDRLALYSQPIVPLAAPGEPSGELLLRMIGPKGEVILPGSFLSVAEKYGQIWEIDQWVIARAAALAARGQRVYVNLSAASVSSVDLLFEIERALRVADAKPADVVFEITETALMGDVDAGRVLARGLAQIGCELALDDFGTGYGSFTYLQKLPFKYLKIDTSFVSDLASSESSQRVVRAIVNIAHEFGQQTIAEGVEDRRTLDLLREFGVDLAQGFYLGRPQPLQLA